MNIWWEYSLSYVKRNKAAGISIIAASFIASLLLSLICGVFYNIRADEIQLIQSKEGDWQARISGDISIQDVKILENHPNVKKAILTDNETGMGKTASLYFYRPGKIYQDLPQIIKRLSIKTGNNTLSVSCHDKLLAQYFIFSPEDGYKPPLIFQVYLFTLLISCLSLILIIHNAFGVSMDARLHQLGILKSIGAAPRQLRTALTREAILLCLVPILSGAGAGTGLCYLFMLFIKKVVASVREYELQFHYHPFIFLAALAVSFLTVWASAGIPARMIGRLKPLEAIRFTGEQPVKKVKRFFLLSHLFGIEGELARKSLYHRRRAFRTSTLSLTLSFLVFCSFLNLEAISDISTRHTFFERYKDKWDLMAAVRDTGETGAELLTDIRSIPGIKECTSYQKASAYTDISKEMLSSSLLSLGGLESLEDTKIKAAGGNYLVETPLLILDAESFDRYCLEIGADTARFQDLNRPGAILVNSIWDNINSNRRNKRRIPFINTENTRTLKLHKNTGRIDGNFSPKPDLHGNSEALAGAGESFNGQYSTSIEITAVTDKFPDIREAFPNFSLLLVMPENSYAELGADFTLSENYFSILAASEEGIMDIEHRLENLLGNDYDYTLENRLETEQSNRSIRNAHKIVIGALAGLLVCIGLANVFSNSLGHIYQRKREFARYVSVGLPPKGVIKVLIAEALVLGLKPILTGLLLNIPLVMFALKVSLITPGEFAKQIPAYPIAVFALVILLGVGLAYYTGGRKLYKSDLMDALKQDTLI